MENTKMGELSPQEKDSVKEKVVNLFDTTPFTEEDVDNIAKTLAHLVDVLKEKEFIEYNGPVLILFVHDIEPLNFSTYSSKLGEDEDLTEEEVDGFVYLLQNNVPTLFYDYENPRIAFQSDKYIVIYTRRLMYEAKTYHDTYEKGVVSILTHEMLHMDRYFKLLGTPEFETICGVTVDGGINHDEEEYIDSIVEKILPELYETDKYNIEGEKI